MSGSTLGVTILRFLSVANGKAGHGLATFVAPLLLALLFVGAHLTAPQAHAHSTAIINVTTTADNNAPCTAEACSLRAAITLANSTPAEDTIELPAGDYTLSREGAGEDENVTGDLDVTAPLTIVGASAQSTIIDADGLDRVFHLQNPGSDSYQVLFQDLTIQGGEVADSGGGVLVGNSVNLRLESVVVRSNNSTGGDGGGGLYLQGTTTTVIRRSTLMENESTFRGGAIAGNSVLAVENSTISGNTGGLGGGLFSNGTTDLRNVTLTNNSGGGIATSAGTSFTIQNTIVAGNLDGDDCLGDVNSNGFNLVSTGCFLASSTASDITAADAGLEPLALNEGSTPTHALALGSPAIDAGNNSEPGTSSNSCFAVDQRGVERPADGSGDSVALCDIGAFELVPNTAAFTLYVPSAEK
ncbi:MAG: CSLREA domain-containing protein [Litorilinea sp.]